MCLRNNYRLSVIYMREQQVLHPPHFRKCIKYGNSLVGERELFGSIRL